MEESARFPLGLIRFARALSAAKGMKFMKVKNRWVVAIVGIVLLLAAGLVYAWSVMSIPISEEFPHWTKAQLSLTFTIMMIMFCLGGMISGFLQTKFTPRVFVLASAVLFLVGFMLASRVTTMIGLYLAFGVLCGLASGIVYNAVMSTVGRWFPDKQGLISGVLLMGFGLSSFLIGKVYQAYTPPVIGGWRSSFVVIGVVIFVVFIICSFLLARPGEGFSVPAAKSKKKYVNPVAMEATPQVMLRQPAFWAYFIWAILGSAAGLALVSQASGIAVQVGSAVPAGTIATVVGLISIFNGVGRVILGGLFDRVGRSITMLLTNLLFILAGAVMLVALNTASFSVLVAGFIIGGLAYGGVTPTNSAFVSSYYGMKSYPMNLSIVNTVLVFASFGSTIAGSLYDASQSYMSTIAMIAVLGALSILVSLSITVIDRNTLKRQ